MSYSPIILIILAFAVLGGLLKWYQGDSCESIALSAARWGLFGAMLTIFGAIFYDNAAADSLYDSSYRVSATASYLRSLS